MQEAGAFLLEVTRLSGLVIAAPLGWNHLPLKLRVLFVLLVAIVIHGPADAVDLRTTSILLIGAAVTSEFFIGIALGMVGRMALGVAELAADAVAPIMGISAAQMFDPAMGAQSTVLTRMIRMVALLVAMILGLHRMLLGAVCQSFRILPAGSLVYPGAVAPDLLRLSSEMLATGMRIALPFLAILFIAQVALAFVARAAPAMQIFSIGFAVTLGIGGSLWVLFAPDLVREIAHLNTFAEDALTRLLRTMSGAAS